MIKYLHIALWLVCFYDALVMLLLPSSVQFILGTDGSAARYIVDFLSIAMAGYVLVTDGFKKLANKWIIVFILVMIVSHFHSPNINFESTFMPKDMAFYNYKPMFEVLVFFLLFMAVSSVDLTADIVRNMFKSINWIAIIYSSYILLQRLGLDQLYKVSGNIEHMSRNPEAGGFLSQPIFAAALLALALPFVIKNGSIWMTLIVMSAIVATGSRTACVAAFICTLIMNPYWMRVGKIVLVAYLVALAGSLLLHVANPQINLHIADTGRLEAWQGLLSDFAHPAFPGINTHYILTGHGIGAFSVLFPFFHHSSFHQAHNELLELIYSTGLIGFIVTWLMVKDLLRQTTIQPVSISILAISICALTQAVWHIPQLAFLTVFLIALAYNKTIGASHVVEI